MQHYGDQIRYMLQQNSQKIINMLHNLDNLAKPLAEFVGLVTQRQDHQLAHAIIKDLTHQIYNNEITLDSGFRNVAKFLSKLSKQAPKALYLNMSELLGFFDCDSYLLRQSLIKILSNMIQTILRDNQADLDEEQKKIYHQTKLKFLELLLKRFHDKSSYCRKKIIKVFIKLTEENHVPRDMYIPLLQRVIGRFKDQTAMVRKQALKLFRQILQIFVVAYSIDVDRGERF